MYDPAEPTPKDVIRGLAADTSNDPASEVLPDATYLAILSRHRAETGAGAPTDTAPFYRSVAESLRRVATTLEQRPSSISAQGDGSVSWSSRTASLRDLAAQYDGFAARLEAEAEDAGLIGPIVTMQAPFLTGNGGYNEW